jgi:hypothetical protein
MMGERRIERESGRNSGMIVVLTRADNRYQQQLVLVLLLVVLVPYQAVSDGSLVSLTRVFITIYRFPEMMQLF